MHPAVSRLLLSGALVIVSAAWLKAAELSVEDFRFDGPLGSAGAKLEKVGPNEFRVTLGHAPEHPDWANNCQFQICRHTKGNALRLEVRFEHPKPQYAFDEYFHSWSHDGRQWQPVQWETKTNGKRNRLIFPVFGEDQVWVGLQVPMSCEDAAALVSSWSKHPHAVVRDLGVSLGGRKLQRLEITDPQSPHPRPQRWVHYFANQHPGEHNSQWRMAGMIQWLLSDRGADCRRRSICHFILMLSPDGPSQGWYRVNAQGVDMNRSYRVEGADPKSQAHEACLAQKDLEALMASPAPVTDVWSMHTWGGLVDPILTPGPEIGTALGPKEQFREILAKHDRHHLVKPLSFRPDQGATTWSAGPGRQFKISAVLCEGAGAIFTKQENLDSGEAIIAAIAEYYHGLRR
jgi:hypothetical protein